MNTIKLNSLDDISNTLIPEILYKGVNSIVHGNGNEMNCRELNSVMITFKSPNSLGHFFSLSQMVYSLVEMIYALSGRTDSELIRYYNEAYRIEDDGYGFFTTPIGKRVYELYGDQVYHSFRELKKSNGTTSAIINLFMNTPGWIGQDCSLGVQFTINHKKELDIHIFYRAVDVINYLRSDVTIYSILHSLMSNWLSMKLGNMLVYTPKIYILENNTNLATSLIKQSKVFKDKSTYQIPIKSDSAIENRKIFSYAVDLIIQWNRNKENDYFNVIRNSDIPEFLKHILKIIYITDNRDSPDFSRMLKTIENSVLLQNVLFFLHYKSEVNLEVN